MILFFHKAQGTITKTMRNYIFAGILGLLTLSSFLLGYGFGAHHSPLDQRLKADIFSAFSQTSSSPATSTASSSLSLTASAPLPATSTPTLSPSVVSLLTSSSSPVNFYSVNKKMQYKILLSVDPCTIERLSNSGWQIFTIGTVTSDLLNFGYDTDCQSKVYIGIDWALFVRERQ